MAADFQQLQGHIRDVVLLPHTFPLWKRIVTWFIWKCPILRLPARILCPRRNPYRRVVAVLDSGSLIAAALHRRRIDL